MVMGVFTTNAAVPKDDQSWLVNRMSDGVASVTLDLSTFLGDKEDDYFASLTDEDTVGYLKSGIPLGRITASGKYGPYDPDATDGRQAAIVGLLESQYEVEFTRTGLKGGADQDAGMRYMGVISRANLPYAVDGATWAGWFIDFDKTAQTVTILSGVPAGTAVPGSTKVTPPMLAGYTEAGKGHVPQVNADGSAFDFNATEPLPAAGAAIADVTAAPSKDDFNKVLAALRAWGIIAAK